MTTAAEFQAAVTKSLANMDRLDRLVNGEEVDDIGIDLGATIPSLRKLIKELNDAAALSIADALSNIGQAAEYTFVVTDPWQAAFTLPIEILAPPFVYKNGLRMLESEFTYATDTVTLNYAAAQDDVVVIVIGEAVVTEEKSFNVISDMKVMKYDQTDTVVAGQTIPIITFRKNTASPIEVRLYRVLSDGSTTQIDAGLYLTGTGTITDNTPDVLTFTQTGDNITITGTQFNSAITGVANATGVIVECVCDEIIDKVGIVKIRDGLDAKFARLYSSASNVKYDTTGTVIGGQVVRLTLTKTGITTSTATVRAYVMRSTGVETQVDASSYLTGSGTITHNSPDANSFTMTGTTIQFTGADFQNAMSLFTNGIGLVVQVTIDGVTDRYGITKVVDGAAGNDTVTVHLFKRALTQPVGSARPSGTFTYNVATQSLSGGTLNGWTTTIPDNNGQPLWVIAQAGASNTGTISLPASSFSAAALHSGAGLNSVTLRLFQRAAASPPPAIPSGDCTFTFSTNTLSGAVGAWTRTITAGTLPLWEISGVAISATDTDTISPSDWSAPVISMQNGAQGDPGPVGPAAKGLKVTADRQNIIYDGAGTPVPSTQTTTFTATKQNSTATVNWSMTDMNGTVRTGFLSSTSGDTVTMTETQFATARNGTPGVIVTATMTDGATALTEKVSIVRVQNGVNGASPPLFSLSADRPAFTFDGLGAASPSSQTVTFTANLQNISGTATFVATLYTSGGTSLGTVTLGGTGNVRTMTVAQFTSLGVVGYAVVTATLGALTDTTTIVKMSDGAPGTPGATGSAGLAAYLSRDSLNLPAYANGTVINYSGATGNFVIRAGATDVSNLFTLSIPSGGNPQGLTGPGGSLVSAQTYTVTGGFDANEDTASLTIRATGSGAYAGVTIDRTFSLGKNKTGFEIVSTLPTTDLFDGRQVYLTTDKKLYRYNGTAWVTSVAATDISGTLADAQIAAVAASKVTGQLTDAQIATLASAKITGQLTDAQIAAIAAAKLTGQITGTQIADDAITTPKIAAGAITTAELAAGSVTTAVIAADAVTSAHIAAGAITTAELAAGAVTTATLAAGAVTTANLAAGAVTTANLAAGAVTAVTIAADAVTSNHIAANAVTTAELAAGAVTANNIAAGAITTSHLAATFVITASAMIGDGVITNAKIGNLEVDNAKIANLAVGTSKIADNSVTKIYSARNNTAVNITSDSTFTTIQSISNVVLTGGVVIINGSFGFLMQGAAAGQIGVEAYITITGAAGGFSTQMQPIMLYTPASGASGGYRGVLPINTSTTLPAGTYTMTLFARLLNTNTSAGTSTYERFLSITELKK